MLPLVLVDALDLHVEERARIAAEEKKAAEEARQQAENSTAAAATTGSAAGATNSTNTTDTPTDTGGSSKGAQVLSFAKAQIGKPYVWAAHGPNAFDCSGIVSAAYKRAGYRVFPQTEVMAAQEPRATGEDRPGDLWGHFGHVQMYLGVIDGKPTVVEAANPRDDIRIDQSGWMNVTWKLRPTRSSK